jgi:hypothetical protein
LGLALPAMGDRQGKPYPTKFSLFREQPAMSQETTVLFRPVGRKEMALIRESGHRAFPPRLFFQPIFYPVLNEEYAAGIARNWNTKDEASGYVGYVTRFQVRSDYLSRYDVQTVGSSIHKEYWIPAEELAEFNENIIGDIEVIAEFHPPGSETHPGKSMLDGQ